MRKAKLAQLALVCCLLGSVTVTAQNRGRAENRNLGRTVPHAEPPSPALSADGAPQAPSNEVNERIFKRESQMQEIIVTYMPVVETYIQIEKSNALLGTTPKSDLYFLGVGDFHGKNLTVHSMLQREHKGSIMWNFEPAGFLQMVFPDWGEFDKDHYQLTYERREFLGEVRCYVFKVARAPKVHGPRFVGRIWVEDQDYTIVRLNGTYVPEIHFSLKRFEDEFYVHFDSWRTNSRPGQWLPAEIFSQEISEPVPTGGPRFKALTHLWGYGVLARRQQEELARTVVEGGAGVKDETNQQDRTPLEQQRGWRHEAESNVMELLQRDGLAAPPGNVGEVLDAIVNNLVVTNNLSGKVDLRCRVLMTSNLELFSVHNTIVLSRGLIDVVPDEETIAALLAFEVVDAMEPKPAHDQYGFSDLLRLKPVEVLRKVSLADKSHEAQWNSERAVELLKKSPYAAKLANAGLFLSQLQSQRRNLKNLISARLGNRVYFTSKLLELAPPLDPANLQQIAALPMGSRTKINPWNDSVTLMKTMQMPPLSPREKMPFEVTPVNLYLTRYVESAEEEHSIVPGTAIPVVNVVRRD